MTTVCCNLPAVKLSKRLPLTLFISPAQTRLVLVPEIILPYQSKASENNTRQHTVQHTVLHPNKALISAPGASQWYAHTLRC